MVTLFSTNCPKCRVLEQKLNKQNIAFEINHDMQEVIDKGFMSAPILKLGDDYMDFITAVAWLNGKAAMKSDCDSCQL